MTKRKRRRSAQPVRLILSCSITGWLMRCFHHVLLHEPDVPGRMVVNREEEPILATITKARRSSETSSETFQDPCSLRLPPIDDVPKFPPWMSSYIDFHNQHLVDTGGRRKPYHLDKTAKILSWSPCRRGRPCGGVGDRINGIIQSFLTAICTDRVFLIDGWEGLDHYLEPRHIAWPIDHVASVPPSKQVIRAMDNRKNPFLIEPSVSRQYDSDRGIEMWTNLWMNETVWARSHCWNEYVNRFEGRAGTDPYLFRTAFHALFRWTPAVLRATDQLTQWAGITGPYIAMHIRTGSGLSWKDPARHAAEEDWTQFAACARKLQAAVATILSDCSSLPIYLASDHPAVKETLLQEHDSIKTVRNLDVVHVDKSRKELLQNTNAAELIVFAEWRVLQEAVCLVQSHSKFSKTAAELGRGCVVLYDDCGDEQVEQAVTALKHQQSTVRS